MQSVRNKVEIFGYYAIHDTLTKQQNVEKLPGMRLPAMEMIKTLHG